MIPSISFVLHGLRSPILQISGNNPLRNDLMDESASLRLRHRLGKACWEPFRKRRGKHITCRFRFCFKTICDAFKTCRQKKGNKEVWIGGRIPTKVFDVGKQESISYSLSDGYLEFSVHDLDYYNRVMIYF